jgi:hypothetical protein
MSFENSCNFSELNQFNPGTHIAKQSVHESHGKSGTIGKDRP